MNKEFWNARYKDNKIVYGRQPNLFFKQFIDTHKPGTILLPAEGEGRNAIYAASKGWQVDAFDFSAVAREKALQWAADERFKINYYTARLEDYRADKQYDAVGLIYVHLPIEVRRLFHMQITKAIRSGGYMVLEAFAKEQLQFDSGGPKDLKMLYDAPSLCNDFQFLHLLSCGQKEIILKEGEFHKGKAAVLQMLGQKL
jgi:hypothetical protein